VIGEGSFGTTYRGTWKGGDCAVKCVRIANPDEAQSFLREVETLALIRHPNIMPFYGELGCGGNVRPESPTQNILDFTVRWLCSVALAARAGLY